MLAVQKEFLLGKKVLFVEVMGRRIEALRF
jgi:hypothetical protein